MEQLFKLGVLSCISFYISEFALILKVNWYYIDCILSTLLFQLRNGNYGILGLFLCAQMGNVKITCLFLFFYSLIIKNLILSYVKMYCYQIWYHLKNFKTFSFYEQLVNV